MIKTYPYEQAKQFQKTFTGMKFQPYFNPLTGFDLIRFDEDYIKKFGDYEDGKTSLSDHITSRFGEKASALVRSLLSMGGVL